MHFSNLVLTEIASTWNMASERGSLTAAHCEWFFSTPKIIADGRGTLARLVESASRIRVQQIGRR